MKQKEIECLENVILFGWWIIKVEICVHFNTYLHTCTKAPVAVCSNRNDDYVFAIIYSNLNALTLWCCNMQWKWKIIAKSFSYS